MLVLNIFTMDRRDGPQREELVRETQEMRRSFDDHAKQDHQNFQQMKIHQAEMEKKIDQNHKELLETMKPWTEAAITLTTSKKWILYILAFAGAVIGLAAYGKTIATFVIRILPK